MTESIFENNVEAIEAWNSVLFDKFVRFRPLLTTGLAKHGTEAIERHPPARGARVIDLGCGFGDTTVELARIVGSEGRVFGVDAAARFIETATEEARSLGVINATFGVRDVESDDLGGPYDMAFARFGTMFFANPVAAFRNVKRSLVPGARLTMVVWRRKDENPFLHEVEKRVLEILPQPDKGDQVTCGPGPFSMASPDVVSAQLRAAGFDRTTFERFDTDICIGTSLDEAIEFAMQLGPAGELIRLSGELGDQKRPEIAAMLRDLLGSLSRSDGGVFAGSSSWIVSAVAR